MAATLSVDQALRKAKSFARKGAAGEAETLYRSVLDRFPDNKRMVTTASSAQVREKLHSGRSKAWRKYENHLGPLIEGLG